MMDFTINAQNLQINDANFGPTSNAVNCLKFATGNLTTVPACNISWDERKPWLTEKGFILVDANLTQEQKNAGSKLVAVFYTKNNDFHFARYCKYSNTATWCEVRSSISSQVQNLNTQTTSGTALKSRSNTTAEFRGFYLYP